ncbi:MAG: protein translocase subunit SecD [Planctomycetota bacterium]
MRHILRNAILCVGLLVFALWAVNPTDPNLRLGKDLRGGTTLVYAVNIDRADNPDEILDKTISVLKERVDPSGVLEIQMVAQGKDRIEVTMPLPSDEVRALRQSYEDALETLRATAVDADAVERAMRLGGEEREAALDRIAGGTDTIREALARAAESYDQARSLRERYDSLAGDVDDAATSAVLDEVAGAVADAEIAYENARDDALRSGLSPERMRRALTLSDEQKLLQDENGELVPYPSPRERAIEDIEAEHPELAAEIDAVEAAFAAYIEQRTGLDDPEELKRLIQAAGVPGFRITVDPQGINAENAHPEEDRLRRELQENGPRNVRSRDARWCRVNKAEQWYDSTLEFEALRAAPAAYFANRGYVVEEYEGDYWMLCWDLRGKRLTQNDGNWAVARSYQTVDQAGRPAIGFEMDARGARLLGDLTGSNLGNQMAVLLDEQVYTAPNLRGNISVRGIIEGGQGGFRPEEIDYIVRVLTAGSLQARLSPEPISQNTIAPEFGQDNLDTGRIAGIIALIAVSVFMVFYYFAYGVIAVVSLVFNAVLILAAMALARAPFTLPGIAGVILTFGMAVDANVLIYERIREELRKGEDLRSAVRLGYQKALSSIVDGNVTNLIVCFVLANPALGTQEIRGFAVTLGIGVVCTLFSALVVSRLMLSVFVDLLRIRTMPMLPMVVPFIERVLEPKINWMGLRWVPVIVSTTFVGLGIFMIGYQGSEMLDTEFRGGTQVEFRLRPAQTGESASSDGYLRLTKADVEARIEAATEDLGPEDPLAPLRNPVVIPINPAGDGVTSDRFLVKTYATATDAVLAEISEAFSDELESRPALVFRGAEVVSPGFDDDLVFPVLDPALGETIGRPDLRNNITPYLGGAAILIENIEPRTSADELLERLEQTRRTESYSQTLSRERDLIVLEGDREIVRSAVVLVGVEAGQGYFDNQALWQAEVAQLEWEIVRIALTSPSIPASVQSFSPVIAQDFQTNAIVAVFLSLLLILIYIWVRFGSVRYSTAAIVCLAHDVMIAIGLIALAEILYKNELTEAVAASLGIEPFKINLSLVAAILTIIGYSLNDTIIIMDRIRENRGKLPYASKEVINLSINQTVSRTVITSGTTLVATLILYTFGGAGVRAFSYALLIGVVIGTYSSIAVAAPLVWSRKLDRAKTSPYRPADLAGGAAEPDHDSTPRLP